LDAGRVLGPAAALLTAVGGCSSAGTQLQRNSNGHDHAHGDHDDDLCYRSEDDFLRELRAKAPSLDTYQDYDLVTLGESVCTYFGPNPALDREGHTDRYAYAVDNLLGMTKINATEADALIHAGAHAYCPVYDHQLARDGG